MQTQVYYNMHMGTIIGTRIIVNKT